MKKSKFTDEHIAVALRQAEADTRVIGVCRKMGISGQTFFRWKKKYGGWGSRSSVVSGSLRRRTGRSKRLVADLTLDKQMLQDVLSKKF